MARQHAAGRAARPLVALVLAVVFAVGAGVTSAAPQTIPAISLSVPPIVDGETSVSIAIDLPGNVAALDGRLLYDVSAASVVGLAPDGGGVALPPQEIRGGVAFGAYNLRSVLGKTRMRVVLDPERPGLLDFTVVIDSAADSAGRRLDMANVAASGTLRVGDARKRFAAPRDRGSARPLRPATAARDLLADGVVGKMDLDHVRDAWETARANAAPCGSEPATYGDANGDGCVDIVDLQLVAATMGTRTGAKPYPTGDWVASTPASISSPTTVSSSTTFSSPTGSRANNAAAVGATFTVTSTADTADARNGDGLCADTRNRCTLRAAITESNWQAGDNRIEFKLPGEAPIEIQLGKNAMSLIQDRSGGLVIDGYSQPGARVNTATVGSNAIPGVLLRGTGNKPRNAGLRITSANNTVRGILFNNVWRAIVVDGPDATNNRIVGNLFGYTRAGALAKYGHYAAVLLNTGAHHNSIGSPSLQDRNASGGGSKAFYLYGPGTDHNVIQNNVMCLTRNGMLPGLCATGLDMNFGPKHNLVGGANPGERNYIGATRWNGVEISHGFDQSGRDKTETWQLIDNRVIGNWIGFRGDGAYGADFRSGRQLTRNDSNGVNVIDGANRNIVEGNFIASAWDGVNVMNPNSSGNIVRNNTIGVSPRGDAAPLGRHGVHLRRATKGNLITGNVIRNVAGYGIGLTHGKVDFTRLSQNLITNMSGVAIYLARGANAGVRPPVITSVTTTRAAGTGIPGATVEVFLASRAAALSGLAAAYLGSAVVGGDGKWSSAISVNAGQVVTALQTDGANNTSALGINVSAIKDTGPTGPSAAFNWQQRVGSLTVDFTDASTGGPVTWSWDFGDSIGSDARNPSHAYESVGTYAVKLTVTSAGGAAASITHEVVVAAVSAGVAADTFERDAASSWGSADVGGAYTLGGNPANFNVADGVGTVELPSAGATRSALLGEVSALDLELSFRVAADSPATEANVMVYAVCRRQATSEYRPRLIFNANGTLSVGASIVVDGAESPLGSPVVVPGVAQAAGAFVRIRVQVTGADPTTIRVKAWADGQPEPANWQFSATNSELILQEAGSVGVRAYAGTALTSVPITLSFDDLAVTRI